MGLLLIYNLYGKNKRILQWLAIFALPMNKVYKHPENAMLVLHVFTVLNEVLSTDLLTDCPSIIVDYVSINAALDILLLWLRLFAIRKADMTISQKKRNFILF